MDKKDLRHMRRSELLEMLFLQSKEIDRLRLVIDEMKSNTDSSDVKVNIDTVKLMNLYMEQCEYVTTLRKEVEELKQELDDKKILISNAGSIAEAALQINKVFEIAQCAADQYLKNVQGAVQESSKVQKDSYSDSLGGNIFNTEDTLKDDRERI